VPRITGSFTEVNCSPLRRTRSGSTYGGLVVLQTSAGFTFLYEDIMLTAAYRYSSIYMGRSHTSPWTKLTDKSLRKVVPCLSAKATSIHFFRIQPK
jgi:hypothetical protein